MAKRLGRIVIAAAVFCGGPSSHALQSESAEHMVSSELRTVNGVVLDADGNPAAGARVTLVPTGLLDLSGASFETVRADAVGRFSFTNISGGRFAVTATADGLEAARANVEPTALPMRLELGRGGRGLSGRVVDRLGRHQANAEVRLTLGLGDAGDIFLAHSGSDGAWEVIVPDGDYLAHAIAPGHESSTRIIPHGRDISDLVLEPRSHPIAPPLAVSEWLARAAVPLNTVEPGGSNSDLAPLGKVVGDARVVGIGEVTHGTREVFKLKHRLVEYLVSELGFTVFAIEFDLAESIAIDDYVMGRGGHPEQLLAAQSVAVWQAEELTDLIRWMKDWNERHDRKIRFHGIDMRMGHRAAEAVMEYLRSVDQSALTSSAATAIAPLANAATYRETLRRSSAELDMLALRAAELSKRLDERKIEYVAKSNHDDWWRAAGQARVLAQMLEWRAGKSRLGKVLVRERAMADNAMQLLDHYGPDAKAIIWAHNAHVSGDPNAEPEMSGVHFRQRLGEDYRALGTVLHRGSYQAAGDDGQLRSYMVLPSPPGSIENVIATAKHPIALLDLRALPASGEVADWFGSFNVMRQFDGLYDDQRPEGWANPAQVVTRNYDALLFIDNGTSARRISVGKRGAR